MRSLVNRFATGLVAFVLLGGTSATSWALGPGAPVGLSFGGGELRGLSGVGGRVLCASCTLREVRAARPEVVGLYELQHRQGQVVMQIDRPEDASNAAWWQSIVSMNHIMAVRTPDYLFAQLMAEENHNRRVALQGLLRPTRTYDIVAVRFLEGRPAPLRTGKAVDAADRAEAAATRAEGAATRTERAAERLDSAARNAESEFERRLRK